MTVPSIDELRHRIDVLTPTLPDQMSRTEVATLMITAQLEGMSTAISEIAERLGSTVQAETAIANLDSLVDGLIATLGGEWEIRWSGRNNE